MQTYRNFGRKVDFFVENLVESFTGWKNSSTFAASNEMQMKMNPYALIGLALLGYFIYKKFNTIEQGLQQNQQDFNDYVEEQQQETIAPAERYLQITPSVTFSEITGNEWTGKVSWKIKNTSSNYTFNITRIKSNIIMNGHTSLFVAGNKDSIKRIVPGATVTINSTWQDKKWYNSDDVTAKDDLRDILRDQMGTALPILECDVAVWVRGTGQVEETKYVFPQLRGYVTLETGAKHYYTNEGEYAGNWED